MEFNWKQRAFAESGRSASAASVIEHPVPYIANDLHSLYPPFVMTYTHLFGPVSSRRLGISLGIDLTPDKTCSLNCLYCECGATRHLTLNRRAYVPTGEVINELRLFLADAPQLDSITFSGSGEPTLHSGIGEVIRFLKTDYPQYRVTVLTNSSLLHLPDVRKELLLADTVVPSLDAVSETCFGKINRPMRGLTSAMILDGIRDFTAEYPGTVWLEVFIIPGINDTDEELSLLRDYLAAVKADEIHLNTLDRPGAVKWIGPASTEELTSVAPRIGLPNVRIVASRRSKCAIPRSETAIVSAILATIQVRPCTIEDLADSLGVAQERLQTEISELLENSEIYAIRGPRGLFYRTAAPGSG